MEYNDENSLSCTVNLAFYFAREYYMIIRELPSGKGFTDICMIPRKRHLDKPAVVIENGIFQIIKVFEGLPN